MIRPETGEDITEEEFNTVLKPFSDNYDEYLESYVLPELIAYYMANNARQLLKVDVCVSFTGNAGPDAMEGKPVGEVHICVATKDFAQVYSLLLEGNRNEIQQQAVDFALDKLLQI